MPISPLLRSRVLAMLLVAVSSSVSAALEASGPTFLRGECNGDGQRDVADAVFALNLLFESGATPPPCEVACDVNDDNTIDIADPILLLTHLFGSGVTIPAPSDQCGVDPTPGGVLTCAEETGSCSLTTPLGFTTLVGGGGTRLSTQETIIRDPVAWQALWNAHASGRIPSPPLPAVDFATQMVVVIVEPVTGPETRIEIIDLLATVDPLTLELVIEVSVLRTFCPSVITIVETPYTIVAADLAPGDPIVQTFDGGCPP